MRHRLDHRKLSRNRAHRKSMLQNLVRDLFVHGRITTTVTRAKEARRLAERLITLGKRGDLHARRRAASVLQDHRIVGKLFGDIAARFKETPGGYTRIIRMGGCRWDGEGRGRWAAQRLGDNGARAFFELVVRKDQAEERFLAGRGTRAREAGAARKKEQPKKEAKAGA
jgi:large subunit ribosomal protein L17